MLHQIPFQHTPILLLRNKNLLLIIEVSFLLLLLDLSNLKNNYNSYANSCQDNFFSSSTNLFLLFRGRITTGFPIPDHGFLLLLLFRGCITPGLPIPDHGFHLFLLFRGCITPGLPLPDHGFHLFLPFRGRITPGFIVPDHGFHLFLLFRGHCAHPSDRL